MIAFSDEEGVRFQSTFLGSAAIAGTLPAETLEISDKRFFLLRLKSCIFVTLFILHIFMHNPSSVV